MDTSAHDFVTVDMRGLKAALVAHARANRATVSFVVRGAVETLLRCGSRGDESLQYGERTSLDGDAWVKRSIRFRAHEALRIEAGAKAAGLSRGAYLAGLADGVPALAKEGLRPELIKALTQSCAELSTLSRNVYQLTALLREGNVAQALAYRKGLESMTGDVGRHLKMASSALAQLQVNSRSHRGSPKLRRERSES